MRIADLLLLAQNEPEPGFLDQILAEIQDKLTAQSAFDIVVVYGPRLLSAIAVFFVGRWVAKIVVGMAVRGCRRAKVDETLLGFLRNVGYFLLLIVVCISALGCLGVNTTSLSAVLAAVGFATGMALQGSLGHIAAGVMLVVFKPFRVGDYVELAGTSGTVVEIRMFNTVLVTPDNIRVIVPNGRITSDTISNYSTEDRRRINMVVGCGYNDDLKAVRQYLEQVVSEDDRILDDPAPVVAVSEMADSSVNFVVRPWVDSSNYWPVRCDLTEKIKLGFDERGFTIPYPSQDVFVHQPNAA